jgi:hypothetical protein
MIYLVYALAALGAYGVIRRTVIVVYSIRKDLRSRPTPWLGLPWGL